MIAADKLVRIKRTAVPLAFFAFTLALMIWSGQNPRVLLYAHLFYLLLRMTTIWYVTSRMEQSRLSALLLRATRPPTRFDRGKPSLDSRTRQPAGIIAYWMGILTMAFMLGVLQLLAGGSGFLAFSVLATELPWGLLLAVLFWVDDIPARQWIVAPDATVNRNLGYNTPAMNFLLAAIFLGGAVLVIGANIVLVINGDLQFRQPWLEWIVLLLLSGLKFGHEIVVQWRHGSQRKALP